jgi:hypothetical protein
VSPRTFCEAELRFLLLFLEEEGSYKANWFLGEKSLNLRDSIPPKVGCPDLSAKQNNTFCFFFWKKKKTTKHTRKEPTLPVQLFV